MFLYSFFPSVYNYLFIWIGVEWKPTSVSFHFLLQWTAIKKLPFFAVLLVLFVCHFFPLLQLSKLKRLLAL